MKIVFIMLFRFQLISSGSQSGDRGSIALGVVFLYLVPQSDLDCFLDDVML